MKKLSFEELEFVKGILHSKIYVWNIFAFCASEHFEHVGKYLSNTVPEMRKEIQIASEMTHNMIQRGSSPIIANSVLDKKIEETESRSNKSFNEDEIIRLGIKLYLEKNLIVRVKRPIAYGNKGDYTGNNERLDSEFRKTPLFAKFESYSEYEQYLESYNSREQYEKWFMENGIMITPCPLSSF